MLALPTNQSPWRDIHPNGYLKSSAQWPAILLLSSSRRVLTHPHRAAPRRNSLLETQRTIIISGRTWSQLNTKVRGDSDVASTTLWIFFSIRRHNPHQATERAFFLCQILLQSMISYNPRSLEWGHYRLPTR
jgi:hypothetical protein